MVACYRRSDSRRLLEMWKNCGKSCHPLASGCWKQYNRVWLSVSSRHSPSLENTGQIEHSGAIRCATQSAAAASSCCSHFAWQPPCSGRKSGLKLQALDFPVQRDPTRGQDDERTAPLDEVDPERERRAAWSAALGTWTAPPAALGTATGGLTAPHGECRRRAESKQGGTFPEQWTMAVYADDRRPSGACRTR